MFYLGNFILLLGMSGLGSTAEEFLYNRYMYGYGMSGSILSELLFAALLTAAAALLIINGWSKKHKHRKFMRIFGIIWGLFGLVTVFSSIGDSYFPVSDIFIHLAVIANGILITLYNMNVLQREPELVRPTAEEIEPKEETESPKPETEIDRIIAKISLARKTKLALNNPSFKTNLEESAVYLNEIQNKGYEINKNILEKIDKILQLYLEIADSNVKTKKVKMALTKIMDAFGPISKALSKIYDDSFSKTQLDIESEIDALTYKLNSEGLFDSDFEES